MKIEDVKGAFENCSALTCFGCHQVSECAVGMDQNGYEATVLAALEKQIPKEAVQLYKLENGSIYGSCPLCGASGMGKMHKHCWRCGQALKWLD